MKIAKIIFFTSSQLLLLSPVKGQVIQNGDFEQGPTATNISQLDYADFWEGGCNGGTPNLYDCESPPIFGLPGPSPIKPPIDCITPRNNGFQNCRFGSIQCKSGFSSSDDSAINNLSSTLQANIHYEIIFFVARGTLLPALSQPIYRQIEVVLRTGGCDDEILVPIPVDIPFGDCEWIEVSAVFQLDVNEAMFGFNQIEVREIPNLGYGFEQIYIDDFSLNSQVSSIESEFDSFGEFRIFPNPTSTILNVETDIFFSRVVIFDLTGKEVISASKLNNIVVENLSIGTYLVIIESEDGLSSYFQRFVKI